MASRAAFSIPKRLISIRISAPHRPPATHSQVRNISSGYGLLGVAKLQPVRDTSYSADTNNLIVYYEESYERWQEEAKLMNELRILPEDMAQIKEIESLSKEQVKDLLELIATDEAHDIQRRWVISANY